MKTMKWLLALGLGAALTALVLKKGTCRRFTGKSAEKEHEKALYQQKRQAQLDEWVAELEKLKARVSGADADVQLELNEQIQALEAQIEDGKAKLEELADAGEDSWESLKEGMESAWGRLKSAFADAASKLAGKSTGG